MKTGSRFTVHGWLGWVLIAVLLVASSSAETTRRRAVLVASRTVKVESNVLQRVGMFGVFLAAPIDSKNEKDFIRWWTTNRVSRVAVKAGQYEITAKPGPKATLLHRAVQPQGLTTAPAGSVMPATITGGLPPP